MQGVSGRTLSAELYWIPKPGSSAPGLGMKCHDEFLSRGPPDSQLQAGPQVRISEKIPPHVPQVPVTDTNPDLLAGHGRPSSLYRTARGRVCAAWVPQKQAPDPRPLH